MTTKVVDDLKERIAAAEKAIEDRQLAPWEKVGRDHAARIMALEEQHRRAKEAAAATNRARAVALAQLLAHEETLLTVELDDMAEWADAGRRLSATVEALTERGKRQSMLEDHAKRRAQNARAENPAALARVNYIKHLKDVMLNDTSPHAEKQKAWKELNELMDADLPKIVQYFPPGFNPRDYDGKGNLRSPK